MRSDAVDQWLSSYLEQPVKLSWESGVGDSLRGTFEGVRLELAGVVTAWLSLERVALRAARLRLVPGLPALVQVQGALVSISLGERELEAWLRSFQLPFRLRLGDEGLIVNTELAGFAVSELEMRLEVVRGWFVLRPRRASLLGIPSQVARWLRVFLPLPPLSPAVRLVEIEHDHGRLTLHLGVSDFEEEVTPGLLARLRRRLLPWSG